MAWEIVVGIESHTQLLTKSKLFSGASTKFGAEPNSQACAIDIALPGVLPVVNAAAVECAIRFGLAVGGDQLPGWNISRRSIFARKNYFYPDLPKGYQISQYEAPIVKGGSVKIVLPTGERTIRLTRAHLEEDAGKSFHEDFHGMTGIDLNRAGMPLLEIVSEPEMHSAQEAIAFARALHKLVTEYEICDGDMEKGSFRCDVNVSVRRTGEPLGTRCEIKNLNSFRFMEQAIQFEAKRQIAILEHGGKVDQETRLFDPDFNETRPMRLKEDAHDYRYFPDPDLLPLVVSDTDIERVRARMPEPLEAKRARFESLGVPSNANETLTSSLTDRTLIFDKVANTIITSTVALPQYKRAAIIANAANMVVSSSSATLGNWVSAISQGIDVPRELGLIQIRVHGGELSSKQAKEVLDAVVNREGTAEEIVAKRGLSQLSEVKEIEKVVDEVLAKNTKQVEDYRAGKERAFNSLVGQVMKATQGKANPAQVNEILKAKLGR